MKNKGVIHCDVKPENVLFTDSKCKNLKLIDFGSSCEDSSTGFSYVQSRMYRAPEIVVKMPYDHAVDVWSTGCLLFELINDAPLFPAEDEHELLIYFSITLGPFPFQVFKEGKTFDEFVTYSPLKEQY